MPSKTIALLREKSWGGVYDISVVKWIGVKL